MTSAELQGWIQISGLLLALGYDAANKIKSVIQQFHPGVTDAEIDEIIRGTIADAERRLALARAQLPGDGGTINGG